jgi:hypothetical protein
MEKVIVGKIADEGENHRLHVDLQRNDPCMNSFNGHRYFLAFSKIGMIGFYPVSDHVGNYRMSLKLGVTLLPGDTIENFKKHIHDLYGYDPFDIQPDGVEEL